LNENTLRILLLGNINISEPTVGDARMTIGTLGLLALKGHQVLYLHQTRSKRKERAPRCKLQAAQAEPDRNSRHRGQRNEDP
jgi:hypothetical protein